MEAGGRRQDNDEGAPRTHVDQPPNSIANLHMCGRVRVLVHVPKTAGVGKLVALCECVCGKVVCVLIEYEPPAYPPIHLLLHLKKLKAPDLLLIIEISTRRRMKTLIPSLF